MGSGAFGARPKIRQTASARNVGGSKSPRKKDDKFSYLATGAKAFIMLLVGYEIPEV